MPLSPFLSPAPAPHEIETVILYGRVAELDALLKDMEDEGTYDEALRYGIEALRHFRDWYGLRGRLPPGTVTERRKAELLEAAWGAELLGMLRRQDPPARAMPA